MSDINLDFTVNNNEIRFTVEPNEITITPTDIQLTLGTSGGAAPAGNVGQLQYKVSALQLGGVPNTLYDGSNLSLGNVANLKITGGTNGYFLQTDGTGNLNWAASGGGGGNGSPGGSNTQVQYNDNGVFGGNVGFTFNEVTGVFTAPFHAGNGSSLSSLTGANVTGQVGYAAVANSVAGANVSGAVNLATYATTANSIAGANVFGQVANALVAGTVYTSAQPNITSVGTLNSLTVAGMTSIQEAKEKIGFPGAVSGLYNFDVLYGAIQYSTANSTANVSLNFRGTSGATLNSVLSAGESTTVTYLMTNGSSAAYDVTSIQIDGVTQTVKYGSSITPVANTIAAYTFTIIKTGSNIYTVLGSESRYL